MRLLAQIVAACLASDIGSSPVLAQPASGRWQGVRVGTLRISDLTVDRRDARRVYAATYDGRALRSTDGGENWTDSGISAPSGDAGLLGIVVHPSEPDVVFAFGFGGLFRTIDRGDSWHRLQPDPLSGSVVSITITRTIPAVMYASAGAGLYRSVDSGTSWQFIVVAPLVAAIAVDPTNADVLYRSYIRPDHPSPNNPGFLEKSVDGGRTWRVLRSDWATAYRWIVVDPAIPSRIYISDGRIHRSDDAGNTWRMMAMAGTHLAVTRQGTLYSALLSGAVLRSVDGGGTWSSAGCGLEIYGVSALAVSYGEDRLYAGSLRGDLFRNLRMDGIGSCSSLFLWDFQYAARLDWKTPDGREGSATAIPLTGESGGFWFFSPANVEVVLKILDGRPVNGHRWVFYASLTNVEFRLIIVDHFAHFSRTYTNPQGQMASVADTAAEFLDPLP